MWGTATKTTDREQYIILIQKKAILSILKRLSLIIFFQSHTLQELFNWNYSLQEATVMNGIWKTPFSPRLNFKTLFKSLTRVLSTSLHTAGLTRSWAPILLLRLAGWWTDCWGWSRNDLLLPMSWGSKRKTILVQITWVKRVKLT